MAMNNQKANASYMSSTNLAVNEVVGESQGLYPGRVAWVHNPDATNENCTNVSSDYWYMDKNTNQEDVDDMLSDVLQMYTDKETNQDAWDAIFKNFNTLHNKGNVGYTSGEKIVIKVNMNAIWYGDNGINTSPHLCLSLLDQLINVVGVSQSDISIGDPNCSMPDYVYDKCSAIFPDVTYWGTGTGRTSVVAHEGAIAWSNGDDADALPQSYIDATYMINVPVLKKHHRAGITLTAKNHFGSVAAFAGGAWHLHPSLPSPDATGAADNGSYGIYRCLVDIMGHKDLGGKTVLYLVDAIWSSTNWGHPPIKWAMSPFNNDWTNSLFVAQDPVAMESVAFDFLFEEFDEDHPTEGAPANGDKGPYPHFQGVDDYLLQAADPNNWPSNLDYDPENDGTILKSLGVHEHWNNATDKQYSRNLGTGNGIELVNKFKIVISIPDTITTENSELPSNNVNTIYIDSSFTVWIGTDAGLSRLTEEGWKHYDTILLNNKVNDLAYELSDYGKELWVATDSGLTVTAFNDIDGVTGSTTYTPENSNMIGHQVRAVTVDLLHNRWVGTDSALCVFRGSTWDAILIGKDALDESFHFYENTITDIEPYDLDTLALIATKGKGIARMQYDLVDGFTGASTYGQPWASIVTDSITAIDVDEELQWYGTEMGAHKHTTNITKDTWPLFNSDSGLVDNAIKTVHIDKRRHAWVGTDAGISIVLADGGIYELTENEGLVKNEVNYITGDINGNVWIATSGGVQWYEGLSGTQTKLGMPTLNSPEDYATDVELSPELQWSSVTGAESYNLLVATNSDFSNIIIDEDGLSKSSYQLSDLDSETEYFWKVSASNSTLNGFYSSVNQFTTMLYTSTDNPFAEKDKVNIYPNPARDIVNITIAPTETQKISMKIYTLGGKLINVPVQINANSSGQTYTFDVSDRSNYPSGIYIVRVQGETFSRVLKLNIN